MPQSTASTVPIARGDERSEWVPHDVRASWSRMIVGRWAAARAVSSLATSSSLGARGFSPRARSHAPRSSRSRSTRERDAGPDRLDGCRRFDPYDRCYRLAGNNLTTTARTLFRFVDSKRATVEVGAVHRADCGLRLLCARHGDEREAARLAAVAIDDEVNFGDASARGERRLNRLFGGIEREIADVKTVAHGAHFFHDSDE